MIQGFTFIISMITQLFAFWFAIDLGGLTIGGILATLFMISTITTIVFMLLGGMPGFGILRREVRK